VLYISRIFAVCPEAGRSARVVVAAEPERIESLAYGVDEAPIATRSVVVESDTLPILFVVHPPPVDAVPPVTVAQTISPSHLFEVLVLRHNWLHFQE